MNNVHPILRDVIKPFAPAPAVVESPELLPFVVSLRFDGQHHEIPVDAFNSGAAICTAIEGFFDGEDAEPTSMNVSVSPAPILPRAA